MTPQYGEGKELVLIGDSGPIQRDKELPVLEADSCPGRKGRRLVVPPGSAVLGLFLRRCRQTGGAHIFLEEVITGQGQQEMGHQGTALTLPVMRPRRELTVRKRRQVEGADSGLGCLPFSDLAWG